VESARARGFNYCGVLALVNGEPAAKCESDADAVYTMMHAGLVFTRMMADRLRQQPQGDSVAWLEKLWTLPSSPGLA
jgi:hypothetical protein